MAEWCCVTGFPPDVFSRLSRTERDEFYKASIRLNPYLKG
ncbi:hypothetical protein J2S43_003735 [Catenuloplanes nepalensis]|uniref:Uncharacterized protein n=1 Tax=Catenuloplanes nepalensis TaxID=587533 RepID=A0ABT9MUX7_9ACTN|nr:hypothetical protein [Catenuloplanes nepalensis]